MADIGIYDGKTVKGPLDSGAGSKSSYIGKTGWPSWAGKKVLSTDGFSFTLDDRDMDDSESDGYLVDPKGGICHLSMQNIGGSNIDSNMWFMFDLKTVLKLNSKFKINGLRGVPKNPKELFLLAQLCQVVHYSIQVGETAEKGSRDKAVWNGSSDQMKELAVAVYTIHNGSGGAKKLFPQGINTIAEERAMSWKEIIENKIEQLVMSRLQNEEDSEYQEFFQKCLKKFGVESPAELEGDEKKKEFFDYVDKNWKGDNEKAEETTEKSVEEEPEKKKKLAASNCGS
jgi:phage pi2 protein 07